MKLLFIYIMSLLFLLSCSNGGDSGKQNGKISDTTAKGNGKITEGNGTTSSGQADTIVWVGIFARWNVSADEQVDGNYDTSSGLFVMCGTHNCRKVPIDQIIFQSRGNCDTAWGDRVRAIEMRRDSIRVISDSLTVIPSSPLKATGIIHIGNQSRIINLKEKDFERIKQLPNSAKSRMLRERALGSSGVVPTESVSTARRSALSPQLRMRSRVDTVRQ